MQDKEKLGNTATPASTEAEQGISKKDMWLLPALSLLTIAVLFAGCEIAARALWPEHGTDPCRIHNVAGGVKHYKPNCSSTVKMPETPWVKNSYNGCGYRTRESCGPKPPGTVRVAVLGSSSSYGFMDQYEDIYTTRLARTFSRLCGRPFEFQNLGYEKSTMLETYHQMDEAIALKPDMMIVVLSPIDVRNYVDPAALEHRDDPPSAVVGPPKADRPPTWIHAHIILPLSDSRSMYMLQSAMFQNPETYLKLYLLHGDDAGFLNSSFSPAWQSRFATADLLLGAMQKKAEAASIPLVLIVEPAAAEVALLYSQPRPGVAANAFPQALMSIAARHNIPAIDGVSGFAGHTDPMGYYYVVDGHLRASGEKVLADTIASQLPSLVPSVFDKCKPPQ